MIPGWFHGRKEMNYTLVGELNFSSCIWCLCSLHSFRLVFSKPLQDQHALEGWFQQREKKTPPNHNSGLERPADLHKAAEVSVE